MDHAASYSHARQVQEILHNPAVSTRQSRVGIRAAHNAPSRTPSCHGDDGRMPRLCKYETCCDLPPGRLRSAPPAQQEATPPCRHASSRVRASLNTWPSTALRPPLLQQKLSATRLNGNERIPTPSHKQRGWVRCVLPPVRPPPGQAKRGWRPSTTASDTVNQTKLIYIGYQLDQIFRCDQPLSCHLVETSDMQSLWPRYDSEPPAIMSSRVQSDGSSSTSGDDIATVAEILPGRAL